jgi:hypothetical protein
MVTRWQSFSSRVRPGIFLTLSLTLMCVYCITYSAFFESQDTTRIYDAASSLARYSDLGRDETLWRNPTDEFTYLPDYPVASYDPTEPMMPIVASLWFRLVDALPIGLVHGTWLFNIFVVALTCGLFFQYARLLDFPDTVALIGALLLGLTTALWVYSKTLFREPLVTLFLLIAAMVIEGWLKTGYLRGLGWALVAVLAVVLMTLTKLSAVMALPSLVLLLIPDKVYNHRRISRFADVLLLIILALIVSLVFIPVVHGQFSNLLMQLSGRFRGTVPFGQEALFTYLFSIGGSLWGTSPVILLGIPGCFLLLRQGKRRLVYCIVLMIAGYALGHAYLTGQHWFGGVSWSPRFLIPVLPFAMLAVLPAIEELMLEQRSIVIYGLTGLLILYSTGIQLIGGLSHLLAYNGLLPSTANGLYEWSGGLNDIRYLRWILLPRSWASLGFDTAWSRLDKPIFAVIYMLLAIIGLFALSQWQHRRVRLLVPVITAALLVTMAIELRLLYQFDGLYEAPNQALHEMLAVLDAESEGGEPLLLEANADVTHERFVMNYNRVDSIRPIIIEIPVYEATSEEDSGCVRDWVIEIQQVCLDSDYPPAMLDWHSIVVIDMLAEQHERIWFLAHNSQFLPWAVRPVEHYLGERFYLLREFTTSDPTVRLLEYSTVNAPNRYDFRLPEQTTNLIYDESIALMGFTLPEGTEYRAGDVVSITLWWQALEPIDTDYVVAWFIVKADFAQPPLQGRDSMPEAGFSPTSQWNTGDMIWDNRAIELPVHIPAGEYRIWILLYSTASGEPVRLAVTGTETQDNEIGILPVTITVLPQN